MFCENCGNALPEGANVCPQCGTAVGNGAAGNQVPYQSQNYVQPQQAYGQFQQAYGQPQQAYGQPQQAYGQSQQAYGQSQQAYGQSQQVYGQPQQVYGQSRRPNEPVGGKGAAVVGLLLGIFGLVGSVFGALLFGIYATIPSLIMCIVGIILAAVAKKKSYGRRGTGGLVLSIIGLVISVITTFGCVAMGTETDGIGAYGCVGAYIEAEKRHKRNIDYDLSDLYNELSGLGY